MNYFYALAICCQVLAIIFAVCARNYDSQKREQDKLIEKENAFKKVIDNIVLGKNIDANLTYFNSFLVPEITDNQLKYIYEQVAKHPIFIGIFSTYDFLSTIVSIKSPHSNNFYLNFLRKKDGLIDVERSLIYNCFQKDSASAYEKELRAYILKTGEPTREFIAWCEFLTQTNNNYKINFLINLFNDNQLIEGLNKVQLKEKCKEWEKLKEELYTYSRFERLEPSWQGTYFEKEIVKLRNSEVSKRSTNT